MVYLRWPDDPAPVIAQARWEGRIAHEARGGGGFGYDPLFLVGAENLTAAELPAVVKNEHSHRGQALRALVAALASGA
jgi:XTP/dITP diphosphohydrolase